MTTWRIVRIFAGCFILFSLLLGVPASPLFHSHGFRRRQPVAERIHLLVPARNHHAQARRAAGSMTFPSRP
jgi:hypothetical protein